MPTLGFRCVNLCLLLISFFTSRTEFSDPDGNVWILQEFSPQVRRSRRAMHIDPMVALRYE